MDEHGSAYARFRRAVDRGNETAALSAAAELGRLGLSDGLELCLVLRRDSPRYEKAIVRWTARYVSEYHVSLDEAQAVLSLLATARDEPYALSALGDLLHRRRGLERVAKVLIRAAREGS